MKLNELSMTSLPLVTQQTSQAKTTTVGHGQPTATSPNNLQTDSSNDKTEAVNKVHDMKHTDRNSIVNDYEKSVTYLEESKLLQSVIRKKGTEDIIRKLPSDEYIQLMELAKGAIDSNA